MAQDELTLAEILTTASAVANYLGAIDVTPDHVAAALEILLGETRMEDLGRPLSPLVRRLPPGQAGSADVAVRDLAGRWFDALHGDVHAVFSAQQLSEFRAEVLGLLP